MLEKLDHIHSKLLYRIEELEKLQAEHSEQIGSLLKDGEHQRNRLRRHSEELANKNVRTEDEEKETYSEFSDKKGINLCRLKHELLMHAVQKNNSVCVHTYNRHAYGRKTFRGTVIFCPKTLAKNVLFLPPPENFSKHHVAVNFNLHFSKRQNSYPFAVNKIHTAPLLCSHGDAKRSVFISLRLETLIKPLRQKCLKQFRFGVLLNPSVLKTLRRRVNNSGDLKPL